MSRLPPAVLFVCSLNRVRSPMAAGLTCKLYGDAMRVHSCGLEPSEEIDPLAGVVMREIGVEIFDHQPKALDDMRLEDFVLIVAMSAEAEGPVRALGERAGAQIDYWPVFDPTAEEGTRDMRLDAFRQTRKELEARITQRFGPPAEWE
jgi:protein-tyrosine-phosphatase